MEKYEKACLRFFNNPYMNAYLLTIQYGNASISRSLNVRFNAPMGADIRRKIM